MQRGQFYCTGQYAEGAVLLHRLSGTINSINSKTKGILLLGPLYDPCRDVIITSL